MKTVKKTFKNLNGLLLCIGLSFFLSSCLKSKKDEINPIANLLFINANPKADLCNLLVDGLIANNTPIRYKEKRGYVYISDGEHVYTVKKNNTVLASGTGTIEAESFNSLFIVENENNTSLLLLFKDSLSLPAVGKAKLRILNATYNAPSLNISVQGGAELAKNITFKNASPFIETDPGTFVLKVEDANNPGGTKFFLPEIQIKADSIYTVWTTGIWNNTGDSTKFNVHLSTH